MSTATATMPRLVIDRSTLPNGLTLLVHENPTHPTVALRCLIHAGAVQDAVDRAGLASFAAACLMRGTERHTFAEINEIADSAGLTLNTGAGRHLASIGSRCLIEDLPLALDLMTEVLCTPTFPAAEIETVRGQIVTAIRQERDNTGAVAERLFRAAAYPTGHPYRLTVSGEEETVQGFQRDDLVACHRDRYGPSRAIMLVSGAVRAAEVRDLVAARLGEWTPEVAPPPAVPHAPTPAPTTTERELAGKTQSDIIFGTLALHRCSPDWEALRQTSLIFGQLGLYGRLGASLRDEQGLAYYVFSELDAGLSRGYWIVRAGVSPANIDRALAGVKTELATLHAGGVTAEELEGVQRYVTGVTALQLETNRGIAGLMQEIELYDLGLDYLERFPSLVHAVTRDAALEVTRRYLPRDEAIVAIAGPGRDGAAG